MPPGAARQSIRLPRAQPPPDFGAQPTETSNDEAPVREVRKRAVNLFLKRYNKISDVKPRIVIEPGMTTPVGEWSQPFITKVNIICRQKTPLSCKDWRKLDRDMKRDLFHEPILGFQEAMVTHQAEAPTENSTPLNQDDIATQVLGTRPGYNRGFGHGFMPPSLGSRHNSVVDDLRKNVDEANRRLEDAERHNEDAERRNAESERRNKELRMQVQALQTWQAQMQSFMS